ncbi:MAG: DUF6512 family protein [Bacilli bacterium]
MNLRKVKIISIFGVFVLSFLFHQMYEWFPNKLFSIFFPVNESIFEHLKMIFTTIIFFILIEKLLLKKVPHNNQILSSFISALSTALIFLISYLILEKIIGGYSTIPTFIVYFISVSLGQLISYYILNLKNNYKVLNIICLILIPVIFTINGYLTYNPIKTHIFYDKYQDKYGIYNYYALNF